MLYIQDVSSVGFFLIVCIIHIMLFMHIISRMREAGGRLNLVSITWPALAVKG